MRKTMNRKPDPAAPDERPLSLRRWSQRKLEARRAEPQVQAESVAPVATAPATALTEPVASANATAALPPLESLTPESDFTAFFSAKTPVDDALKRAALKTLLRDPRFNVMDGLDTYIDDYTREDPIPESVLRRMAHAQQFLAPEHREAPPLVEGEGIDTPPSLSAAASLPAQPAAAPALTISDSALETHDTASADASRTTPTNKS
ncbi:MAG TPA: DUF3306 domain-containing protein [Casimicrobiaceae bacterium]